MEIEEQNAMNVLEIKRRQSEVLVWRRMQEIPDDGYDESKMNGLGSNNNNNSGANTSVNNKDGLGGDIYSQSSVNYG